jgi:hypothetical protein
MPIAVAPPASQIRRTRPIGARCAASEVKSGVGSKHRNQDRERNQAVVVITDHRFSRHRSSLRTPFRIRRHLARVHRQVMSQETRPTKAEVRATISVVEGGSVGFQIGGQATDFVLLVMNDRGANGILSSKVKLGADASVAAGPVGRDASAETDVSMRAEILSYSRARGLFAGISLEGSTIRPDSDANKRIYGEKLSAKDIVIAHETHIPPAAEDLISTLNAKTPKYKSP